MNKTTKTKPSKRKARKAREWWVIVDYDGICFTGFADAPNSRNEARKQAKQLAQDYVGKHEAVLVREVLPKKKKVKK